MTTATNPLHRLARAASPASEQPWIDAFFAELAEIEGMGPRVLWLLGAVQLIAAGGSQSFLRAASLIAIPLSLGATLIFGALFAIEYEGARIEDDLFAVFAGLSAAAFAGLLIRAHAYNRSGPLS
jgi:hypothetical protein